jgi:hypothetical protein
MAADFKDGVEKVARALIGNNTLIIPLPQGFYPLELWVDALNNRLMQLDEDQWSASIAANDASINHIEKSGCLGICIGNQDYAGFFMVWVNQTTSELHVMYYNDD